MKKCKSNAGETLSEVLVALLLVSLTFLFLTGAVISAAKGNNALRNEQISTPAEKTKITLQINGKPVEVTPYTITLTEGGETYCYYE